MSRIAVIGMACRYPDARDPAELWQTVLAQRRAFRRMPAERMRMDDYFSPDRTAEDRTYSREAAVIEDYQFDRVRFRVTGDAFRSADPAHWLALDIASQALVDAGFPDAAGLPRESTGVVLANTLTGDGARASLMRLRWPYVRRVVAAALKDKNWSEHASADFLAELEDLYKAPFAPIGEESLAGGLSNTIAGRICNHFDLKGCGYTVDGACAASLLAVSAACTALADGDLDVALAGGVDLSLDPFELVGFAKAGALAESEMRVYDARSQGFWPGEGCGFVVLMRLDDALAAKLRIYAVVRGWGISSDGGGGITRPEADGQLLAFQRAYRKAGFGIDTVAYFEGHGTGTNVGDATELAALTAARRQADPDVSAAALGSIKANFGHTKAAAGLAGFIKTALAVHHRIIPPITGCDEPHAILREDRPALRTPLLAEPWPHNAPVRAAVSAMGFGGVNTHVVLEATDAQPQVAQPPSTVDDVAQPPSAVVHATLAPTVSSFQDSELFLFAAPTSSDLAARLRRIHSYAERLSRCELTDLACELQRRLTGDPIRAAVVASTPVELHQHLTTLLKWLDEPQTAHIDAQAGVFLGGGGAVPRIGFVFPGQGSPAHRDGGLWRRRFPSVDRLYNSAHLPTTGDDVATDVAQPAIVAASLAALAVLKQLGIEATAAIGHSLGELTALHWAGAMDSDGLLEIACARGKAMADLAGPTGEMLAVATAPGDVESLIAGLPVLVSAYNTPQLTVVSGDGPAIAQVARRAADRALKTTKLRVSHAFHSPLVAPSARNLSNFLADRPFSALEKPVFSTITGDRLNHDEDLRNLLIRQITSPVRFVEAARRLADECDLLIEVGPGSVMAGLLGQFIETPVISLDAAGPSLAGLLSTFAAVFVRHAPVDAACLFVGRFSRPFNLDWNRTFLVNPCELAPTAEGPAVATRTPRQSRGLRDGVGAAMPHSGSPFEVVRHLVASRAELPVDSVRSESRLLADLHLNSIMVGQVVSEASRQMGLPPPVAPTEFATATVGAVAQALKELAATGHATTRRDEPFPPGVDTWYRPFAVRWIRRDMAAVLRAASYAPHSGWRVIAPPGVPFTDSLRAELAASAGDGGVVLILPDGRDESCIPLLLEAAHAALADRAASRFILVQQRPGAEAFARTLHLEAPHLLTRVITLPFDQPDVLRRILGESTGVAPFCESLYDADGVRWEPVIAPATSEDELGNTASEILRQSRGLKDIVGDVLFVTGGGKGIAAECALDLARKSGARLILMGRSDPAADAELSKNLEWFRAAGVTVRYLSADVTDVQAVRNALHGAQAELGPITAFIHGAGVNEPRLIADMTQEIIRRTAAPKIAGARNVLAVLDPARLRLFVTFGSIIARAGLAGEADYALANDWLARLTEDWQRDHPHCRCRCLEWSVWSGVGMGQRLGRVETLARHGVTPITPDQGVEILRELLQQQPLDVRVVVCGRFGDPTTLRFEKSKPPFLRFLEKPRVFYPGVELVADAVLSIDSDPYVNDHVFRGQRLLPAVVGLEAMAQAAMAVTGAGEPPSFENATFDRPIVIPDKGSITLRVAALARDEGRVDVVLRSSETDFVVDCFRAACRFGPRAKLVPVRNDLLANQAVLADSMRLDAELYGRILFHSGRFRRIDGYRLLRARHCLAQLAEPQWSAWFGRVLPQQLVLGDPAARDAAIHAIQACIPHNTILPTGVDRLTIFADAARHRRFIHATERSRDGDRFIYDVDVLDPDGNVVEQWQGLHLRVIEPTKTSAAPWPYALLVPYLERRLEDLLQVDVAVALHRNGAQSRPESADYALRALLGHDAAIHRRPDGKPVTDNGRSIAAAHAGDLTLAVVAGNPLGCDLETVVDRSPQDWKDLIGADHLALSRRIADEAREDESAAATRVWTALESLKKAGLPPDAPLVLDSVSPDGWVQLRTGQITAATYVAPVGDAPQRLAFGIVVSKRTL